MKTSSFISVGLLATILTGCSSDYVKEAPSQESTTERKYRGLGKAFGEDSIVYGGPKKDDDEATGLGVNSHLWRASLDTLSFMPLASADPFGGVIMTDWYSPHGDDRERLKVTVYILDRQLRSDGVKVSVFRQTQSGGNWRDQPVEASTARELENTILMRARTYRSKKG